MKNVSFIIPTFNGTHLLEKNLPAVLSAAQNNDEIVIIDDAGSDGTFEWLQKKFVLRNVEKISEYSVWKNICVEKNKTLFIVVIQNYTNLRFAKSCNRAIELSKHELIFLLNNDVSPSPDILISLLPHFEDKNIFAVGCLEKEGNVLSGKKRLWFARGMFMHSKGDDFENTEMDWISGGSGIFDKEKWIQLHGFDPLFYPAYWEDVDLGYRARKKGWKILFENKAIVEHQHESTNQNVFGQESIKKMSWENSQKFLMKNGSLWQKLQFFLWKPYWWLQWWKLKK